MKNGIYHRKNLFYSSVLSLVGSMIFILLVVFTLLDKVQSIGKLEGIYEYSMSLNQVIEKLDPIADTPGFGNITINANYD